MDDNTKSFLCNPDVIITDIKWLEDDFGSYWTGKFHNKSTGQRGVTGSYYDLSKDGKRSSREEQEEEIKSFQGEEND